MIFLRVCAYTFIYLHNNWVRRFGYISIIDWLRIESGIIRIFTGFFLQQNSLFEKLGIVNISLHKLLNSTCQFLHMELNIESFYIIYMNNIHRIVWIIVINAWIREYMKIIIFDEQETKLSVDIEEEAEKSLNMSSCKRKIWALCVHFTNAPKLTSQ